MQLNLNKKFLSLSGDEENGWTMGQLLAKALSTLDCGIDILKVMPWAFTLFKNEAIDIDKTDLERIYNFIKALPDITQLIQSKVTMPLATLEILARLVPIYRAQLLDAIKVVLAT